ncbi:MAG TPA: GAF domain-containing protein [Bacteroidales bacterium]|nr:GAF domain-containing protein [Bacteroidales bacterium]
MKLINPTNRFIPVIVLILLLTSSLLVFSLIYNSALETGQKISPWIIGICLLPFLLGLWLYFIIVKQRNHADGLQSQIKSLKAQEVETFMKSQKKETAKEIQKEPLEYKKLLERIIPNIPTDDIEKYGEVLLANVAKTVEIVQGQFYFKNLQTNMFRFKAGYAFYSESIPPEYREGETLAGQVAKNQKLINIDNIPEGYITILSGLGKGSPKHLIIAPIITTENKTIGIIELTSFKPFTSEHEELFSQLGRKLGEILSVNQK